MSEQNGAAYALGVSMGILSYHATAGNLEETHRGINVAKQAGTRVEATGVDLNLQGFDGEDFALFELWYQNGIENPDGTADWVRTRLANLVVNLRGEYQGSIEGASSGAGRAYALGVAISIAEAQATAGEAARGIVLDSLDNAIDPAKGLGLDITELEEIRAAVVAGVGLPDIYMRITNLRGLFQSKVETTQAPPVIHIPKKA